MKLFSYFTSVYMIIIIIIISYFTSVYMIIIIITLLEVHFVMINKCNSIFSKTSQSEPRDIGGGTLKELSWCYLGCVNSLLWKCYPRKRVH